MSTRLKRLARLVRRRRVIADVTFARKREAIARKYIAGSGIEIGGLNAPLDIPDGVRVRYVDRAPTDELRAHYPELDGQPLAEPDVIDDAQTLATFTDDSQDFVIANHLLEHMENPLRALDNMLRVLRPGGILYLAVPDKRYTFDIDRPTTPLAHVVKDFELGPGRSRRAHYEEWARKVDKKPDSDVDEHVRDLLARDYSIHFHVWTFDDVVELLNAFASRTAQQFDIELATQNAHENIFVLRKAG